MKEAKLKFEDAVKRLEKIIEKLETGDITLDESLKLFQEGMSLSQDCLKKLDEVERKIELITKDKNGENTVKAFPTDDVMDE